MTTEQIDYEEVKAFIANLDQRGLSQLAGQLLMYPDSRPYFIKCAKEWFKAYTFPIGEWEAVNE